MFSVKITCAGDLVVIQESAKFRTINVVKGVAESENQIVFLGIEVARVKL